MQLDKQQNGKSYFLFVFKLCFEKRCLLIILGKKKQTTVVQYYSTANTSVPELTDGPP